MISINFVTDDPPRWGAGLHRVLDANEIDRNFWELKAAVENLVANPPAAVQIASFTLLGTGMVITMTNGSSVGPLPLPVLTWRWRDAWLPFSPYLALDVFQIVDVGIFLVLRDHTSAATFDPDAEDLSSNRLYQQIFSFAISPSSIATGLTAAGTNQATALQLSLGWSVISTAASGTGVALPAGAIGTQAWIRNSGANAILVYPHAGDSAAINSQSANVGFTIEPNSAQNFRSVSLTQWYTEN